SDSSAADTAQALSTMLDGLALPTARLRRLRRAADAALRFDFDGALALLREDASAHADAETDTDPTSSGSPA
ncbi:hypothetical protein, partial [Mitsuaria sp. GD03876]|uniref:hypothetical protein n=1 Tax=Mitsuaria sp. GD03876 TaxID=2975399 RepID=UPI002449D1CD